MFAVILLTKSKIKLIVPAKWILSLDIVQALNYGISHTKKHIVFFSKDLSALPNFQLLVQEVYDENMVCCYEAFLLHLFGKSKLILIFFFNKSINSTVYNIFVCIELIEDSYEDAVQYCSSRRHVLPAVYNFNLEKFHWGPRHTEYSICNSNNNDGVDQTANSNRPIKEEPKILYLNAPGLTLNVSDDQNESEMQLNIPADENGACSLQHNIDNEENQLDDNLANEIDAFEGDFDDNSNANVDVNDEINEDRVVIHQNNPFYQDIVNASTSAAFNSNEIDGDNTYNPFLSDSESNSTGEQQLISVDNGDIKRVTKIPYLNEPNIVYDLTDENFVAIRKELAIDHEDTNSDEEIEREFENLKKIGVVLPAPMKIESEVESNLEESSIVSTHDIVLGNIPRIIDVNILDILKL